MLVDLSPTVGISRNHNWNQRKSFSLIRQLQRIQQKPTFPLLLRFHFLISHSSVIVFLNLHLYINAPQLLTKCLIDPSSVSPQKIKRRRTNGGPETRKKRERGKEKKETEEAKKMEVQAGNYVEVCSREDGFLGSYYAAKVIRELGKNKLKVEYLTLLADDNDRVLLGEVVEASDLRSATGHTCFRLPCSG